MLVPLNTLPDGRVHTPQSFIRMFCDVTVVLNIAVFLRFFLGEGFRSNYKPYYA